MMGQGDKKIRIRRTNEQLDKEVISEFEKLPNFEMEKIEFFDELPHEWTYPLIQPVLLEKVKKQYFAK